MILVFGKTGQVSCELARQSDDVICLDRQAADLANPDACAAIIADTRAQAIINAAAYTAVDQAETEPDQAHLINADAPGAMARAAARRGLPFVHISTDYVFDGSGTDPWLPQSATGPLGVYGASKLAGEDQVRAAGGPHAILRTAWVFSAHGKNFVKTMLALSETRDQLRIVADQFGGPTPAADIAQTCFQVAKGLMDDPVRSGTYHYSGAPDVSWAEFAAEIFAQAGRAVAIESIPSSEFPTPAQRPANSRLDCATTQSVFGINRPDWKAGLADVLKELTT